MNSTVEPTFDLLAEAAGCRHPNPERENRGLCPAHGDHNNPGLVFRIADSGKLITHCFSQACTPEDIADSIGVPISAFFPGGSISRFAVKVPAVYVEPSLLELLKLVPLGLSFDEQQAAVFRCLDSGYHSGVMDDDTLDIEQPMRELPTVSLMAYIRMWVEDILGNRNFHDVADAVLSTLRKLNRSERTHQLSTGSAIPMREA